MSVARSRLHAPLARLVALGAAALVLSPFCCARTARSRPAGNEQAIPDLRPFWVGPGPALQHWIWHPRVESEQARVGFRRLVDIIPAASHLIIEVTADNAYVLWVNGRRLGSAADFRRIERYVVRVGDAVWPGTNVLAVEVVNTGGPGGLLCGVQVGLRTGETRDLLAGEWLAALEPGPGWELPGYEPRGWFAATPVAARGQPPWPAVQAEQPDTYVAFRGRFRIERPGPVDLRILGASWFGAWLDGQRLIEGPARFPRLHPEYDVASASLSRGDHVLAVLVHNEGVVTRMLGDIPPFLACQLLQDGRSIPISWRGERMSGFVSQVRRLNPQLGWIEWCDTRQVPAGWQRPDWDDRVFGPAVACDPGIGPVGPLSTATTRSIVRPMRSIAQGPLAETFGYEKDDVPARFLLRDRECRRLPPQGVWRRYDLGRVRLGKPRLVLDLPPGAVVELGYSEALVEGRVSPYIPLSGGPSCNLDHYIARGGLQEFSPLTPRGARFVEAHVLAEAAGIRFVEEEFLERAYHGDPQGSFECDDPLLDEIWRTGIETYRACAEDALVDNPTRERGQWTGDVLEIGMEIASAGYADLRALRRGLVQSARCARSDGLVAALCPGGEAYSTTAAAQWLGACMRYVELTGDRTVLAQLLEAAERNTNALERLLSAGPRSGPAAPGFIDWGYVPGSGASDLPTGLHHLAALRAMTRWCQAVGDVPRAAYHGDRGRALEATLRAALAGAPGPAATPDARRYHSMVLGSRLGLVEPAARSEVTAFLKRHLLSCFPRQASAPRHAGPGLEESRLITPYFAHYALRELIEHGEMDFVLDQYRTSWGHFLKEGFTTWPEVFDRRWSHCHQWAGCPTWQLSRYALGLHPRFDLGRDHFVLKLIPGRLERAAGRVPLPGRTAALDVRWTRSGDRIRYGIRAPVAISLRTDPDDPRTALAIQGHRTLEFERHGSRFIPR
jgi:hypothetical protein